ncbi:MAG: ABC-F family ATP-binding cassette domain-containing protein [Hyphomicrobiales bacterium]
MISINNLSKHYTGKDLFTSLSLQFFDKERVGLVGKNGCGKTTLMRILAGREEVSSGEVIIDSSTEVGYLEQEIKYKSQKTVFEEAITAFDDLINLKKEGEKIALEIQNREDYESEEYLNLIDKLSLIDEQYRLHGGSNMEGNTEKVLMGLGFKPTDFSRPMMEFSNGWQMRVELAKILLKQPGFLLLDEPTNHLDIESIQWLEGYLNNYPGSLMLVSHDRAFLDNICKRTIEISNNKAYDYKANYSAYVTMREERLEQQKSAFDNQQKEIQEIEKFVERFRYKSTKAKQVQSRIKHLEKMDKIEIDNIDQSHINFKFQDAPPSGKVALEADMLSKSYGDLQVLKEIDFMTVRGDKIAFVGKNGEGKSTLSRIIVGELDYEGQLKLGHNIKIGYYAQNQGETLDVEKTVFQTIDDIAVGDVRTKIRGILGSFLFGSDDIEKKVKVLSGGEKARLALAKLLLEPYNLLILDEPTNHLDMISKDILKNALIAFDGTLIVVSHDRDFLQGLSNKVFEFKDKKIKEHIGDIYDFLERKKMSELTQLEDAGKKSSGQKKEENISDNKLKYEKRKEVEKEIRKLKSSVEQSEKTMENLELLIAEKNKMMAEPEKYAEQIQSGELYKEYNDLKGKLNEEMELWESISIQLEEKIEEKENI